VAVRDVLAGEARDAQRTFPRAIVAGTAVLIGIYMLANVAYVSALGVEGVQAPTAWRERGGRAVRPAGGKLIAAVILVSMFSAANGLTLTAPRMYYAMARDGVFFQKLGEVHPRFGTPRSRSSRARCGPRCSPPRARSSSCSPTWCSRGGSSTGLGRAQHLRLPPPRARLAAPVPGARLSRDAGAVRGRRRGDRAERDDHAARARGRRAGRGARGRAGVPALALACRPSAGPEPPLAAATSERP
jgi:hypothetical protein